MSIDRDSLIHSLVSRFKDLAKDLGHTPSRTELTESGVSDYQVRIVGGYEEILKLSGLPPRLKNTRKKPVEENSPAKILVFDIETSPMELYGYALFDQNFSIPQIKKDWYVLSWAAKWLGSPEHEVMYSDNREAEDLSDDKGILSQIWQLLDEADVVITQNGIRFDSKKLNARFIKHGFPPPSSYRHIDTYRIGKKHFGFTSHKLEYMTGLLCKKYKKLDHAEFKGFELWRACLEKNPAAWICMEKYNRYDVLSLEELYLILRPWDKTINFNVFLAEGNKCSCGSEDLRFDGYAYTNGSKKERYSCSICGSEYISKENLLTKSRLKQILK